MTAVLHVDRGIFSIFFMYFIQHCFICHPQILLCRKMQDAGIEPRIVATLALAVRLDLIHTRLDLIQTLLDHLIHYSARFHPQYMYPHVLSIYEIFFPSKTHICDTISERAICYQILYCIKGITKPFSLAVKFEIESYSHQWWPAS
jgi:hypothetical protein